jgi:hypothetical protein
MRLRRRRRAGWKVVKQLRQMEFTGISVSGQLASATLGPVRLRREEWPASFPVRFDRSPKDG